MFVCMYLCYAIPKRGLSGIDLRPSTNTKVVISVIML